VGGDLHRSKLGSVQDRVTENGNTGELGNNFFEKLQLFPSQFRQVKKYSRNIAAGLCESSGESLGNRVTLQIYGDHRDRARRTLGRLHGGGSARIDNIDILVTPEGSEQVNLSP
jgi:hypothetical protein